MKKLPSNVHPGYTRLEITREDIRDWLSFLETMARRRGMQCPACDVYVRPHGDILGHNPHAKLCPLVMLIQHRPDAPSLYPYFTFEFPEQDTTGGEHGPENENQQSPQ